MTTFSDYVLWLKSTKWKNYFIDTNWDYWYFSFKDANWELYKEPNRKNIFKKFIKKIFKFINEKIKKNE